MEATLDVVGVTVTVEYSVDEPAESDDPTYIGFDVGESALMLSGLLEQRASSLHVAVCRPAPGVTNRIE